MKVFHFGACAGLLAGLGFFGGCSSLGPTDQRVHTISSTVSVVGEAEAEAEADDGRVRLGAGDELGRAMFEQYVRLVRAEREPGNEPGSRPKPMLVQSEPSR